MNRTTDVIVAGTGLAGLMAALAAARKGAKTRVFSEGMGCLSISSGVIDLLGYNYTGVRADDPWAAMDQLPEDHPYSVLGKEAITEALDEFAKVMEAAGMPYAVAQKDGKGVNSLAPTIMGTLKPTWLAPAGEAYENLTTAKKILAVSVKGFRDCRARLITSQLRRYPDFEHREYGTLVLPPPFAEHGRSLNALDLARAADRPAGRDWLLKNLKDAGKGYDVVLLPPLLGARPDSPIRKEVRDALGAPAIELLCTPPGVGGMRVRAALMDALHKLKVEFFENAEIIDAKTCDEGVEFTVRGAGRDITHKARAAAIATGGTLAGGVILSPGKGRERVFGVEIPMPANVDDWSEPEMFGKHLVAGIGVKVDRNLQALDKSANSALNRAFFGGRTLGGYDPSVEKSGHGVAAATGWKAGQLAADMALGATDGQTTMGEAQ